MKEKRREKGTEVGYCSRGEKRCAAELENGEEIREERYRQGKEGNREE